MDPVGVVHVDQQTSEEQLHRRVFRTDVQGSRLVTVEELRGHVEIRQTESQVRGRLRQGARVIVRGDARGNETLEGQERIVDEIRPELTFDRVEQREDRRVHVTLAHRVNGGLNPQAFVVVGDLIVGDQPEQDVDQRGVGDARQMSDERLHRLFGGLQ